MNNLISGISTLLLYNICATALVSMSMFYFYKITGVIDFSFALSIVMTPYIAYVTSLQSHTGLLVSCLIGLLVSSFVLAPLLYFIIYGTSRRKASGQLGHMIISLGLYTIGINCISILTDDLVSAFTNTQISAITPLLGMALTTGQILVMVGALICVCFMAIIQNKSKMGLMVKAVSNNIPLSVMIGFPVDFVKFITYICGMLVVGYFGLAFSLDHGLIPTMGLSPFLTGMVIVIISHKYEVNYLIIVSVGFTIIQFIVTWLIGSQWMDAITFSVLLSYLLFMRRRAMME